MSERTAQPAGLREGDDPTPGRLGVSERTARRAGRHESVRGGSA